MSDLKIEKVACPTEDEWHGLRRGKITASTAGALFPKVFKEIDGKLVEIAAGAMGFTTPFKLYHVLSGSMTEEDISGNEAIKRGNLIEKLGVHIIADSDLGFTDVFYNDGADRVFYQNKELGIGATPDFICKSKEGKTTIIQLKSVERGIFEKKWRQPDGTVKAPNWIFLQATIEAFMVGLEMGIDPLTEMNAYVLPVKVSFDVETPFLPVELNANAKAMWDAFVNRAQDFHKMVADKVEPPIDLTKDGDVLDWSYAGIDGLSINLTTDVEADRKLALYNYAREKGKEAEIIKEQVRTWFKHKMGNAQVAHLNGGKRIKWLDKSTDGRRMMVIPKVDVDGEKFVPPNAKSEFTAPADF